MSSAAQPIRQAVGGSQRQVCRRQAKFDQTAQRHFGNSVGVPGYIADGFGACPGDADEWGRAQ
jgi:hypothetical protein